jgi:uncharacterized protein (DUF2342 family)
MGKTRTGMEGVVRRVTSQILGIQGWWRRAEEREIGGVFWRRLSSRRGCSAIDGMKQEVQDQHKNLKGLT